MGRGLAAPDGVACATRWAREGCCLSRLFASRSGSPVARPAPRFRSSRTRSSAFSSWPTTSDARIESLRGAWCAAWRRCLRAGHVGIAPSARRTGGLDVRSAAFTGELPARMGVRQLGEAAAHPAVSGWRHMSTGRPDLSRVHVDVATVSDSRFPRSGDTQVINLSSRMPTPAGRMPTPVGRPDPPT